MAQSKARLYLSANEFYETAGTRAGTAEEPQPQHRWTNWFFCDLPFDELLRVPMHPRCFSPDSDDSRDIIWNMVAEHIPVRTDVGASSTIPKCNE